MKFEKYAISVTLSFTLIFVFYDLKCRDSNENGFRMSITQLIYHYRSFTSGIRMPHERTASA